MNLTAYHVRNQNKLSSNVYSYPPDYGLSILFPTEGIRGPLIVGLGKEMCKMSLGHLVQPDRKETNKDHKPPPSLAQGEAKPASEQDQEVACQAAKWGLDSSKALHHGRPEKLREPFPSLLPLMLCLVAFPFLNSGSVGRY